MEGQYVKRKAAIVRGIGEEEIAFHHREYDHYDQSNYADRLIVSCRFYIFKKLSTPHPLDFVFRAIPSFPPSPFHLPELDSLPCFLFF